MAALLKSGLNHDFRLDNNCALGSVNRTKPRVTKRKGPSYRRINRYFKSVNQCKKEKARREQILQMYVVDHGNRQYMADKLGVSVSTVKRDLKKLQPYIRGQMNRAIRLMEAEWTREREQRMEGLSLRERFDVLSEELERIRALRRGANYRGHYTIFHLDMTQPDAYGLPKLTLLPPQTRNATLAYPYKIRVVVRSSYEGRTFEATLGGFNIIQRTLW